jgi:sarcosine oxidase
VTENFGVIVIGLGAVGAASLYQLARRGRNVLGIDRFSPPHDKGSTHGETRITRLASGEGAVYTQFARRSHEIWRELERETGERLLVQNGLLVISGPGPRASAHGNPAFLDSTIDAARDNGVAHEVLPHDAIRRRFPAFNVADGDRAYYEQESGFLFPERCVQVQLQAAKRAGAATHMNETVQRFESRPGHVDVVTDRGAYRADKVVLAAGPWVPKLLPPALARAFTIRRQVLAWFQLADGVPAERYRPEAFPVFYWQLPRRQSLYGFPYIGNGEPSIKIATEQYDTMTTAEAVDRTISPEEIAAVHSEYVAGFLPGVSDRCIKATTCLYTCVDDARFIVDTLPDQPRVILASPCSGHGFKHSPAIGEAIAELATQGRTTRVSLEEFKLSA